MSVSRTPSACTSNVAGCDFCLLGAHGANACRHQCRSVKRACQVQKKQSKLMLHALHNRHCVALAWKHWRLCQRETHTVLRDLGVVVFCVLLEMSFDKLAEGSPYRC